MEHDEKSRIFTSVDGYRSYLLIIDHRSWHVWINLARTKHLPISFITRFFEVYGLKAGHQVVRTDPGGELWGLA
jgi:hypothetical protein